MLKFLRVGAFPSSGDNDMKHKMQIPLLRAHITLSYMLYVVGRCP